MAFIEQEANEKAEEIDAKAEEEFNIEKGRLVQQQRIKIMEYYEKKEKQVELQKKIQSSNMLNQARLKVLKVREDHVRSVLDEARRRLGAVTQDASRYSQILQSLITQGLFQIMEANIMIRGRKQDAQLIQNVLPASVEQYKRETGKDVVVTLDTESYLSTDSTGGIEIFALQGRIRVSDDVDDDDADLNVNFYIRRSSTHSNHVSSWLLNSWFLKSVRLFSESTPVVNSPIKLRNQQVIRNLLCCFFIST